MYVEKKQHISNKFKKSGKYNHVCVCLTASVCVHECEMHGGENI